jgi:hypothetical protein
VICDKRWYGNKGSDKDKRLYVIIKLAEADLRVPDTYLPKIKVFTISDLSNSAQPTFPHKKHRAAEPKQEEDQGRLSISLLLSMRIASQLKQTGRRSR